MAEYTRFGEFMRIQRIKNHEVMGDTATLLNVKVPFVSAVECGKRNVPEEWEEIISNHYHLNNEEKKELKQAIDESRTQVKVNLTEATNNQRKVALLFQRSFDAIDDEIAEKIIGILKSNK